MEQYANNPVAGSWRLLPPIMSRAVQLSAVATVVAVLLGGALLGIIGALVAIPIAAALQLIMREVVCCMERRIAVAGWSGR
jgi:NCAIR mutase (PurE)-related protein